MSLTQTLIKDNGHIPVLLEGSVFNSWNLIKPGVSIKFDFLSCFIGINMLSSLIVIAEVH